MRGWNRHVEDGDLLAVLNTARRIATDLDAGLDGSRGRDAAKRLRRMLSARTVGLANLSGGIEWAGEVVADEAATAAVADALRTGKPSGSAELVAMPLTVADEPAGVLLVAGPAGAREVRGAAWLVEYVLERARLRAAAERAAQSELRALRAEMSPHFVYNALTVIAALVRSDPDRSRELILDFADYARYSLARHGEFTTVADEFEAIETYLALQRAVMGDRLRIQIRVAPDVLAVPLPFLVLQPLVENAVRHGIEPRGSGGAVRVRGEAHDGDCVISVEDDGVGMTPAHAQALLDGKSSGSVGLGNVDRRLRTAYGQWYGLVVETERDAGTRVSVRVPLSQPGVRTS
ncbi:sensor histidine kinase [Nocardia sp. NPDC059240]|uniref:sensor histidine kinase n=1 Tax=Nocardia sp. NPDC059240 TaxID=3346786 RepID=UPI00369E0EDD